MWYKTSCSEPGFSCHSANNRHRCLLPKKYGVTDKPLKQIVSGKGQGKRSWALASGCQVLAVPQQLFGMLGILSSGIRTRAQSLNDCPTSHSKCSRRAALWIQFYLTLMFVVWSWGSGLCRWRVSPVPGHLREDQSLPPTETWSKWFRR